MRRWGLSLLVALGLSVPPVTWAQISPGPLARPHAGLEGSAQCLKCHDTQGVSAARCLACHTLLASRVASGRGLHARNDYRDCQRCHIEHQGREFELVFWGEQGRARFDHSLTGFNLEGRHRQVVCEDCHQKRRRLPAAELAAGRAGSGSLLGLERVCSSCHADEHRGQFAGRDCTACHGQQSWKPATGFDHARAAFRLDGRHNGVACERCHPSEQAAGGRSTRRYTGLSFGACSSCHKDPHEGRLGSACSTCHTVESWRPRASAAFDHDRTAYPLRGRHRTVACEICHQPGRGHRLAHERCTSCHADAHAGQLLTRADQGRCEACHDVQGFVPARFGPEEHARAAFPLAGAHLAVPCNDCHRPVAVASFKRPSAAAPALAPNKKGTTLRFRLAATRCADCHADRHEGELERYVKAGGCESCHGVSSWREIRFDHAQARFKLDGAHERLECVRCHPRLDAGTQRQRPRLRGLALTCEGCHRDPHEGQLTRPGLTSPCERCHSTSDWKPIRFDHNRDSTYTLDGAHAHLACAACHRKETRGGVTVTHFRPLGQRCKDCHVTQPPSTRGGTQ